MFQKENNLNVSGKDAPACLKFIKKNITFIQCTYKGINAFCSILNSQLHVSEKLCIIFAETECSFLNAMDLQTYNSSSQLEHNQNSDHSSYHSDVQASATPLVTSEALESMPVLVFF